MSEGSEQADRPVKVKDRKTRATDRTFEATERKGKTTDGMIIATERGQNDRWNDQSDEITVAFVVYYLIMWTKGVMFYEVFSTIFY